MLRLTFFLIMVTYLACSSASAQLTFKVSSPGKISVFQTPAKMRVLYVGVDNPIEIESVKIPKSALVMKWRAIPNEPVTGALFRDSTTKDYIAVPNTPCMVTLDIYYKDSLINSEQYRCKSIPTPIATVGGKYGGGIIAPALMLSGSGIVPILENFDFSCRVSVVSYSMTYVSCGVAKTVSTTGPVYSAQMKDIITSAKPNDVILFNNIVVSYSGGGFATLSPIAFVIS
ncbi:MAG: hypothetical protein JST90_02525 [Bacteroidetes bacterium]|nr:hypothetical protein [Bacteroidota bacterium]